MAFIRMFSLLVLLGGALGCVGEAPKGHCEKLNLIATYPDVQAKLALWVDNDLEKSLLMDDFRYGGGIVPGQYGIPDMGFDWNLLEMDKNISGVRILTGAALEKEPVMSVSFAEVSRKSILVKLKNSEHFGIKDTENLRLITDRIAIYCYQ